MFGLSGIRVSLEGRLSSASYYRFSGAVLVGTYVLMLLGAYTSAIGAGLSCPDWPTCYGTVVPFFNPEIVASSPYTALQIFAEWAHRGLAMIMGFAILGTAVAAHLLEKPPIVRWSATVALVLLPIQVILGALTVTENLKPIIVTAHLGTAILILLGLATTTIVDWLDSRGRRPAHPGPRHIADD